MARIIESVTGSRRIIKLSAADVISVVKDYQQIVPRFITEKEAIDYLTDRIIFIPEDF
jgi:hypothetical protein